MKDWGLAGNLIDFIKNSNLTIKKVVEDFDLMSLILQFDNSVGADITGTTGDENFHVNSFFGDFKLYYTCFKVILRNMR